ncbi:ABC transporter substrate-binding protein [Ancylobacter sonchi]|uniref:ABC transporter substrate-binding protein n=1 Tax=Ancylobacter sonchi TaxID=1937790 RepID=UPI001BD28614|nr:ABC transporter substrate-binding protein [Ancylobacter sonchi]MBS7535204.1 ABC transporter substrate-binding protein [Ancylobacter sonchi]
MSHPISRTFGRRLLIAAAALAAFVAIPARAETPPDVIRLAGQGNAAGKPYGSAVIGVVRAKEYLEKEFAKDGVKIEWQFPRGTGPAINEALANGQADFANYGGLPNIVGRGAGLKTKVLASYGTNPSYLVARPDRGVEKIADLKGKKIAVSRGTINELALNRVLAQGGLTEKDVTIFDLQSADQVAAVTTGDVDAVLGGNNLLPLVEKGTVKTVYSTKGSPAPGSLFGSFIVTEAFASKYPETTKRVVKAFVEAAAFASDEKNRDAVLDIWALTGVPREALANDFAGDKLADRLSPLLDDFYKTNITNGVTFALENKLIKTSFDVNQWIDPTYLNAAIKELGVEKAWTARNAKGEPQS